MKINPDEQNLLQRGGRPTLADLLDKMTFSPTRGAIDLNGARMVLSRATFGADLQDELVRRFGQHEAMVLMLRLGYRNGREDAEFIRRAWPNLDVGDAFTAGTRLHMVTGTVRVETLHNDFDFRNDRFSGDFLWHQSVEATEYQRRHGRATGPVCWAQTGYAAGYASVFFRKLVLYKEVSCAAMGDKSCRVVGKTVDEWGKDDPFVRLFLDEVLSSRAEMPSRNRTSSPKRGRANTGVLEEMIAAPVRREIDRLAMAGLGTIITGPEGTGRFEAAAALHAKRFPTGQLHRAHGASAALPALVADLRKSLSQKGAREQTLVIEALETMPKDVELELVDLLRSEAAANGNFLLVGISRHAPDELFRNGALGSEFLHGLSVLPVAMPSLAARSDDISLFADVFLSQLSARQPGFAGHLTPQAREVIRAQDWPGNLPELRSVVVRAAILAEDPAAIGADDMIRALGELSRQVGGHARAPGRDGARAEAIGPVWQAITPLLEAGLSIDEVLAAIEDHAVEEAQGNISAASRRLGLSRAKLDYRLKARS